MPAQDNTPPFSRRRARTCTAGVSETAANKLLVAGIAKTCAKPRQHCRTLDARQPGGADGIRELLDYSHSIVPGGLLVISKQTRLTPFTSLIIRLESFSNSSYGSFTQSAVMPSWDSTARIAMVYS